MISNLKIVIQYFTFFFVCYVCKISVYFALEHISIQTSHISRAQQAYVVSGFHIEKHRPREMSSTS